MTAVGVARPSAQGQATTRTATPKSKAKRRGRSSSYQRRGMSLASARPSQRQKAPSAQSTTPATKWRATRSARASIFVLDAWASSTRRTMPANNESSPTASTQARRTPGPAFVVPPKTRSPLRFGTGSDSPVSMDSSAVVSPKVTTASAGTAAPGATLTTSPRRSEAASTTSSASSTTTTASRGRSDRSACSASDVRPLAADSRRLPRSTNAIRMADVSK
mmetsp:Transcript_16482/g.49214  ORF Transcript_16482/g.49214 Transcript_16482/m.49214 type:complete len:220 (-) Transcript_16482:662-1321(-)